jgi:hypothetical protein
MISIKKIYWECQMRKSLNKKAETGMDRSAPLVCDLYQYCPVFVSQEGGHPAVAVASVLAGQLNDPGSHELFIIGWALVVSLG